MFDLITRLRNFKSQFDVKQCDQWRQLVVAAADEKQMDEESVLETLQRLGKTLEDLENAVKSVHRRRSERKSVEAAAAAEKEIKDLTEAMVKETARFEPIERKHNELIESLDNQRAYLKNVRDQGLQAQDRLIQSCTDENALSAYRAVQAIEQEMQNDLRLSDSEIRRISEAITYLSPASDSVDPESPQVLKLKEQFADLQKARATLELKAKKGADAVASARLRLAETEL